MRRWGKLYMMMLPMVASMQAQAAGTELSASAHSPWYAVWYLWIALGVFIIIIVAIVGAGNKQGNK